MEKYSALCLLLYVIAGCVADGEYLQRFRSLIFAVFNTAVFFVNCQLRTSILSVYIKLTFL